MANWARGLAAGLETGYRMGDIYQRGAERRALQEAATEQAQQQYTPEMGTELERIAGLTTQNAQGETVPQYQLTTQPGSVNYGLSQYNPETGGYDVVRTGAGASAQPYQIAPQQFSMYGKTYNEQLTPERERGLRMERMAGVVAESDPIRAEQLRALSAEQDFQAKYRPMQLESAGLKLEGERAEAADRKRMGDFQTWLQEDPTRGQNFQAVAAKARELGMSTKQQYEIASNLTGIDKAEFEASQSSIRKLLQGKDLNGALAAHKDSDLITPGSHYEVVRGKNGQVSLNNVDTATGKIIQANIFSGTEAEALGYLNKAAMDPASVVDYTLQLQKSKAAIMQAEASARASDATVGLRSAQLTALQNQQAGSVEAARIREQYMELTPEEQAGAKGQGLIRQFNMANVKAGVAVPLGTAARPERDKDQEAWLTAEKELIKKNAKPEQITQQRDQFFARRGYAPDLLQRVVLSGVDPSTGQQLTMQQIDDFNKKYPKSAVKPDQLPWVQREATRQGLINQIPR